MIATKMRVVEVKTSIGRLYQLRFLPDKPPIVHRIIFGISEPVRARSPEWREAVAAHAARAGEIR